MILHLPGCSRITTPFLVSTRPLSRECRERDLVCFMSSMPGRHETLRLTHSLPFTEWHPRMWNGNGLIITSRKGISHHSEILGLAAFTRHGVDVEWTFQAVAAALMHGIHARESGPSLELRAAHSRSICAELIQASC